MTIELLATVELRLALPDSTDPGKVTPGFLAAVLGDLIEIEDGDVTPFAFREITVTNVSLAEPVSDDDLEILHTQATYPHALDLGGSAPDNDDEDYWHNRCHATFFERTDELGVAPLTLLHSLSHDEFGARIYSDPDTQRMFVFWTDWVANDWYQEVANLAAGHKFLAALTTAVNEGRELTAEEEATAGMA